MDCYDYRTHLPDFLVFPLFQGHQEALGHLESQANPIENVLANRVFGILGYYISHSKICACVRPSRWSLLN